MPSGNLPALNFLGSGQRTTGEFQAAVNELQNYVVSLKNEIDALSNTIVKESAVRTVGSGTGEIPDKSVLDTRLGTGGNLGSAATRDVGAAGADLTDNIRVSTRIGTSGNLSLAPEISSGEFNPALSETVWSGPGLSTDPSTWTEDGTGFYVIVWGDFTTEENGQTLIYIDQSNSYDAEVLAAYIHPHIYMINNVSGSYQVDKISTADGSTTQVSILQVKKV